jgi:hypothetical protein
LVSFPLIQFGAGDLPVWFEAGEQLNGTQFTDGVTLFWIQMLLMNWVEVRRFMDMKNPGSQNQVSLRFRAAKQQSACDLGVLLAPVEIWLYKILRCQAKVSQAAGTPT